MAKPEITGVVPVLGMRSYEETVAHYVDWLGFRLDWEWRAAPGQPVIMAVSRDAVELMLNESGPAHPGWLAVRVAHLDAFAEALNAKRPESATVVVQEPYDIPTLSLRDPFGNHIDFNEPLSAEEEAAREQRAERMRAYIRKQLDAGHPCPTPEELVTAIGRPPGLAMDVLCEFPEYERATRSTDA